MNHDTIVIFYSKTGFTQQYARWICEKLDCECMDLAHAKKANLDSYQTIIFGGYACAGQVSKLNWFKEKMKKWGDKKLAVYCVGASPIENPDVAVSMKNCLSEEEHKKAQVFYCPGGLNYERMSLAAKLMMKALARSLRSKKDSTESEKVMAEMITKSYDLSDFKYVDPIVEWASGKK